MKTIEELLADTNQRLRWAEPMPGLAGDGSKHDGTAFVTATVADCIRKARWSAHYRDPEGAMKLTPADLLQEFMAVHWATEAE